MSMLAYRYGVRVLREHEEPPEIGDELVRRTRYWNALVELEQAFRARIDELVDPHLVGIEDEDARRDARKAALKLPEVAEAIKAAERDMYRRQKQLRAESGLYWGNYLPVERAWQTARQSNPRALRFHRSSPLEGTLSVAFQDGGMSVADFWSHSRSLLQITPLPPEVASIASARERKRRSWTPFRMRVAGKHPNGVDMTGVVCLHRPLPEDGIIRGAHLTVRPRNGHKGRLYELIITVELPDAEPTPDRTVWGVDVGWRQVEGGMRVAVAASDRERRDLVIPQALLDLHDRAHGLSAHLDRNRDDLRAALVQWRDTHADAPEWLREELANVGQWRAYGRFHHLYRRWERFLGDEEIFGRLEAWEHRARHLEQYRRGTVERAERWRDDLYGVWARRLVADAGVIHVEDTNWRELAQQASYTGAQRTVAAVGALIERIRQTATREGVTVVSVPSEHSTADCSYCGHRNSYDTARSVMVRCEHCLREYDQDYNAALNLRARTASDRGSRARSAQREAHWKRIARLSREKQEAGAASNG